MITSPERKYDDGGDVLRKIALLKIDVAKIGEGRRMTNYFF
jgi:hypothetical protein